MLLYGATRVPVGEDQRQHLELAREIVRRFNARFGETFAEPQPLFSTTPKILGLDGQAKMSKSLGNTIALAETDAAVWDKLRTAATDPARVKRTDPGTPEKCNIYTLHKFFSTHRAAGGGAHGLHDGGDRLHRLQEDALRGGEVRPRRDPRPRRGAAGRSGAGRSDPGGGRRASRAPWPARPWQRVRARLGLPTARP